MVGYQRENELGGAFIKISDITKQLTSLLNGDTRTVSMQEICDLLIKLPYEYILSQKVILKIYQSNQLNDADKKTLYSFLIDKHQKENGELQKYISYSEMFFLILDRLYQSIKIEIEKNFEKSLFLFLYLLGKYMTDNLNMLIFPKTLMYHIASKVLIDDTNWGELQSKILFAESKYNKKVDILKKIYREAIEYGCIFEKYDDLSYSKLFVSDITYERKPTVRLILKNPNYERGIRLGELFDEAQFERGMVREAETIHKFYECKICKYCYLTNKGKLKEEMLSELSRQFNHMTFTDRLYFSTGKIPSYILSILGYLYMELIKLLVISPDTYCKIKISDIKNGMCFNNYIDIQDFNDCIEAIFSQRKSFANFNDVIPFFKYGNDIIVAKWMYNFYFSLVEESKNIALNAKRNYKFGKSSNYFGKNIFEGFVKNLMQGFGWGVLASPLKVNKTDFDLVAFKNGFLILGQLKTAHTNAEKYQLWKAEQSILSAVKQLDECKSAMEKDKNLLFSNLKREKILKKKDDIQCIIYIVITSSNYFGMFPCSQDISVIGLDMFVDVVKYCDGKEQCLKDVLNCPYQLYEEYTDIPEKKESVIETDNFVMLFEEVE